MGVLFIIDARGLALYMSLKLFIDLESKDCEEDPHYNISSHHRNVESNVATMLSNLNTQSKILLNYLPLMFIKTRVHSTTYHTSPKTSYHTIRFS